MKDDEGINIIDYDTYDTVSNIHTQTTQIMNIGIYDNYMLACSKNGKASIYVIDTNEVLFLLESFLRRNLKSCSSQMVFKGEDINMLFDGYKKEDYPSSSILNVILAGGQG